MKKFFWKSDAAHHIRKLFCFASYKIREQNCVVFLVLSIWQICDRKYFEMSTWQEQGKELIEMSTWCRNKERNSLRCPRGARTRKGSHWDVHVAGTRNKELIEMSTWQDKGKELIEISTWCRNKERNSLRYPRGAGTRKGSHWDFHVGTRKGTHWDVFVAGTRKGTHWDVHVDGTRNKELIGKMQILSETFHLGSQLFSSNSDSNMLYSAIQYNNFSCKKILAYQLITALDVPREPKKKKKSF